MPRSSTAEMAALRAEVMDRDRGCIWPDCPYPRGRLELVHLRHRGMGGSREANTPENCVIMCETHHSVYDGRIVGVAAREEWKRLFRALARDRDEGDIDGP